MSEQTETVYTIYDWYDGPRTGAANLGGAPYWYRTVNWDTGDWDPHDDRFELIPLTSEALSWVMERNDIFARWDSARKSGIVKWDDHDTDFFGALPEEMSQSRQLDHLIETYLRTHSPVILARGHFELGCNEVRWEPLNRLDLPS